MKETRFLATILIESPLMFEILEKIRDKYSIDKLDPNKDPYKQRVRQDMATAIRAVPHLQSPIFAAIMKIIQG